MKYLALIIMVMFLYICHGKDNNLIKTIDALSPKGPEIKNLSEIATDIQYIPLETTPEAVMRFVNYLKTANNKFYINTVLELLCFSKSGKFLYKLDQQGRGPNEYIYISDDEIMRIKGLLSDTMFTINRDYK